MLGEDFFFFHLFLLFEIGSNVAWLIISTRSWEQARHSRD
jgi:hypothetical protein